MDTSTIIDALYRGDFNVIIEHLKKHTPPRSGCIKLPIGEITEDQILDLYNHIRKVGKWDSWENNVSDSILSTGFNEAFTPMDISPRILEALLEKGFNVDTDICRGSRLVHYYCSYSSEEHLEVLIRFGPNLNLKNEKGLLPQDKLDLNSSIGQRCLKLLSKCGDIGELEIALRDFEIKDNAHRFEYCLLNISKLSSNQVERLIKTYLRYNPKHHIDMIFHSNIPIFNYICKIGSSDLLEILLKFKPTLHLRDRDGRTPIDYIVSGIKSGKRVPDYKKCLDLFLKAISA